VIRHRKLENLEVYRRTPSGPSGSQSSLDACHMAWCCSPHAPSERNESELQHRMPDYVPDSFGDGPERALRGSRQQPTLTTNRDHDRPGRQRRIGQSPAACRTSRPVPLRVLPPLAPAFASRLRTIAVITEQ